MRFRLLSGVLKIAFIVADSSIFWGSPLFADSPRSYVGLLPALEAINVKEFDLRSDGRYLFYSTGSASWNAVDLLDMNTVGSQNVSSSSGVVALFYRSPNELIVVSGNKIELYDVTQVFQPKLRSTPYSFGSSSLPIDACLGENGQIFILEFSSLGNHLIRILNASFMALKTISWSELFADSGIASQDLFPSFIRCSKAGAIVLAEEELQNASRFWLGRIGTDLEVFSPTEIQQSGYNLQDLIVDSYSQRVLTLFNRDSLQLNFSDSLLKTFNFDEEGGSSFLNSFNLGSGGKALSAFLKNSKPSYGVFVEKDFLSDSLSPPQNQILQFQAESSASNLQLQLDRGVENAIFSSISPIFSQWRSSSSDHYSYGLFSSQGLGLLSDSMKLELVDVKNSTLSSSNDLSFTLRANKDADLRIRLIDDLKTEGEAAGININRGSLVSSMSLEEDKELEVQISSDQIKTTKETNLRLLLLAAEKNQSGVSIARVGLPFRVDKEPPSVQKFKLGFGDRSLRVFFDLPYDPGDIDYFLIFMAKSEAELFDLPESLNELNTNWNELKFEGHEGASFSNPIKIDKSEWKGSFEIAPLKNDEEIYVRVLVVDRSSNFSLENPESVSSRPRATLSLQKAFGAQGCAIGASIKDASGTVAAFIFFIAYLLIIRWGKKLGPALEKSEGRGLRSFGAEPKLNNRNVLNI